MNLDLRGLGCILAVGAVSFVTLIGLGIWKLVQFLTA